jgi:pyrroloquinoline quinone (PQQ) biosynthesis protein C
MAAKSNGRFERLSEELVKMANDVFQSPEYGHFLSLPLTRKRAAYYIFERSHYHLNRRQCWALVQSIAPFEVKQIIWHHEEEELAGDKERGVENHWVLGMKEGAVVGMKPKDFKKPPSEGTLICTYAWSGLAENSPWLEAIAASGALEIANSDALIKGGGIANRIAGKMHEELGIPLKEQHSNKEHMEVDVEHANLLFQVAKKYVHNKEQEEQVLRGAANSLAINKSWLDLMATQMDKMN